jgi:hypothetical protein
VTMASLQRRKGKYSDNRQNRSFSMFPGLLKPHLRIMSFVRWTNWIEESRRLSVFHLGINGISSDATQVILNNEIEKLQNHPNSIYSCK